MKSYRYVKAKIGLGTLAWLGGAFHVAAQPDMGFFDGVFWLWYVGRYVAQHFAALP